MVRHVFMWRVAPGADAAVIIEVLESLRKVASVDALQVAANQAEPNENGSPWDGVLISDHASWEALDAYSNDPYHGEVVAKLLPMFSDRAVVDFEVA